MKLTSVPKIRAHRVFRDFVWPSGLHHFAQFNLIYGWNGSGKTTLSSLLSLVEKRTELREGEVELELEGGVKIAGSAFDSAQLPQVRVFNREFINTTLHSAGGIAPIYFLGEENAQKQARVDELRAELRRANTDVAAAETKRNAVDVARENFGSSTKSGQRRSVSSRRLARSSQPEIA